MDSRPSGTASSAPSGNTASPVVLRLLPHVHHPPASVLVLGSGGDAGALHARGYRVREVQHPGSAPGGFDLVCEAGAFSQLPPDTYVDAVAAVLRPGGKLFGGFSGIDASGLIHLFSRAFEVERVDPSGFAGVALEVVLVRR